MSAITKLLIANRGEIALRVMRTAKAMGLKTVAVYSDADAKAPHVKFADQSVHIGPSPVNESYLRADKILDAAKATGANAIHPGYGFLSENADFAKACKTAGLIFVGPPEEAVNVMGDKARSKRAMIAAGVPCVPGYQGEDQSDATLIAESKNMTFPIMVKAAAGGGGRGMRLVHEPKDLENAIKLARSEAENAFGDGALIIEKAVQEPRHVELQVFADRAGNTIHLGERDCSVQRRHQKVIEEAPCPVMTPELRAAMGEAAVNAAKAVNYEGAGTVEFLLDRSGEFYFLEMNTRLQVEHPVTEMITGLDLVALQLRVAQGEDLGITQEDVTLTGHSIEVRLYAEDPSQDFLPSTGPITLWQAPDTARVDSGIETSGEVSPFYDSMVAKIITHASTRDGARRKMIAALEGTALIGPQNNRDFLIDALGQDSFAKGEATTAFIAQVYGENGYTPAPLSALDSALAAITEYSLACSQAKLQALEVNCELLGWSSTGPIETVYLYGHDEEQIALRIRSTEKGTTIVLPEGEESFSVKATDGANFDVILSGEHHSVTAVQARSGEMHIVSESRSYSVRNIAGGIGAGEDAAGGGTVRAPMHGQLLEITVSAGDAVEKGDKIAVLEAMKMQHEILAEVDGVVAEITAAAGTQIAADDLIMDITPDEEDGDA
ncbi:MAG: acetyl-CoA carboxylase biotin carboxylase subunit [Maricaulaceae bacterium]